jgi:hypothetical protein
MVVSIKNKIRVLIASLPRLFEAVSVGCGGLDVGLGLEGELVPSHGGELVDALKAQGARCPDMGIIAGVLASFVYAIAREKKVRAAIQNRKNVEMLRSLYAELVFPGTAGGFGVAEVDETSVILVRVDSAWDCRA